LFGGWWGRGGVAVGNQQFGLCYMKGAGGLTKPSKYGRFGALTRIREKLPHESAFFQKRLLARWGGGFGGTEGAYRMPRQETLFLGFGWW